MKKIMFNDRYGLTEAVLQGRKTVIRRLINKLPNNHTNAKYMNYCLSLKKPPYEVGEIVAVAQSYKDAGIGFVPQDLENPRKWGFTKRMKAWINKMFVYADLMPHQIRILDVRAERLQDITDEDCLKEGVSAVAEMDGYNDYYLDYPQGQSKKLGYYSSAREAFASLIDKISGKGTWESNPFVWRIEFELVK